MSHEYDRYLTHQLTPLPMRLDWSEMLASRCFTMVSTFRLQLPPRLGTRPRLWRHAPSSSCRARIHERSCRRCFARGRSRLYSVVADSTELTFDTTTFLNSRPAMYDLILMFHVLEHVLWHEALPLLTAAGGALRPGGWLVLEVPNVAHPLTGPYHRYHDFTHTLGFTDQSLAFILRIQAERRVSRERAAIFHPPESGRSG